MPTYEYVCTKCGASLEVVQSIHEPSLTVCPTCGDGRLRKVFGNVGVVFKGSGFYRTDNRSRTKGGGAAAKSESAAKPESPAKPEASPKPEKSRSGSTPDARSAPGQTSRSEPARKDASGGGGAASAKPSS